ncbi:guanylate kinase [Liquorilactobacillus satsumensis]|uniref:guanylate kinase n=1 Tax=Liquorilactobacillus satsumensis TaxID=259059 RepID=UPI0021C38F7A|nr:guanylate kinase [Liquorilactobacillus satsumensis]MCP9329130.1 guanylate kinase [Liquorilactobacillus satsumensis]
MKKLLVLCGGPGTGKTTIQHYLEEKYGFSRVLTHTTRPRRKGETDRKDYYFETKTSFFRNRYFEYMEYDGNFYGSSAESLARTWQHHDNAVIVLDTKGALAYKQKLRTKQVSFWYIAVADQNILGQRLLKRGEAKERAARRLQSKEAIRDMQMPQQLRTFCEVLLNDDWGKTTAEIELFLRRDGFLK